MATEEKPAKRSRRRGVPEENNTPFSEQVAARWPNAVRAYKLGLLSIIPILGLLLALPALYFGFGTLIKHRGDAEFKGRSLCVVAVILTTATLLTQAVGIALMINDWPWA